MYGIWNRLQYVLSPQFDIYEQVAKKVSGVVADIGSGTGFGTQLLSRNADRVVGFEVDSFANNFSIRAFANGKVVFYVGDIAEGISLGAGTYNFVTMIDVIEHIEDDLKALKNVKKLLAPGGVFICSTPNEWSRYRNSENHVREYSPIGFENLLKMVFPNVSLRGHDLELMPTEYANPMIGVCQC